MSVIIELPESPWHHHNHHHHDHHRHRRYRRHSFPTRGMATVGPGTVLPTAGVRVAGNVYDPYGLPPRPASTTPYSLGVAPAYPAYSHSAYSVPSVPVMPYGTPYGASVGMAYGAATVAPTVQYTTPAIASTSYGYYPSSMQYAPTYWQPAAVAGPGAILRYSPSAGERFAGGMEKFVGHMTGDPLLVAHGQQKQMGLASTAAYTTRYPYGNPRGYY